MILSAVSFRSLRGNLFFQLGSLLPERSGFFSGVQMFEEGFVRFFAAAQVSDP